MLSAINGAKHTLAVEDEEMADPAVTGALAAAGRGVRVSVVMTEDSEWDKAFAALRKAGVHIRLYPDDSSALYIHAKAIVKTIAADLAHAGQSGKAGGKARCTATARVYNAKQHENDVYVHSNQPDNEATASAAGYSHSYRTSSSGYA